MTGQECYEAALSLLTESINSASYYDRFALPCLNRLLANCLREENALRDSRGALPLSVAPRLDEIGDEIPYDEAMVEECFPYGLAALLVCDDDKNKFNWLGTEFAQRLGLHCPAGFTTVEEMY